MSPDWEIPMLCCVLVMARITGTSNCSLPDEKAILTVPRYVPAANGPGFAVTITEPGPKAGAAPLVEADSQAPPKLVVAAALKERGWLPRLLTFRNCEVEAEPTVTENDSPRGSTETCGPLPGRTRMLKGKVLLIGGMAMGRSGTLMTKATVMLKLYWP